MVNLNLRHKLGLFLAVVATGFTLLLEASAKQTAGVLLLGVAAAWLIGSLSARTLGIVGCLLVCTLGLFIAVLPVKVDWDTYQRTSREYDFAVSQLREAIAKSPATPHDDKQYDTSQLDVVQHRTLGTLKFPHAMPYDERNRIIERMEARAKGQLVPQYPATKTVESLKVRIHGCANQ